MELISIEDLEKIKLSYGNIFIKRNENAKSILVVKAGDWISPEFIDKYKRKGVKSFYIHSVISVDKVELYCSYFSHLRDHPDIRLSKKIHQDLLLTIQEGLWPGGEDESFLNWMIACHRHFFCLSDEQSTQLINSNQDYFRRSLMVSSVAIIFSLCCGYISYKTLKDIYLASFLVDISLWRTGPSFTMGAAVKTENTAWGNGINYLSSHPSLKNELKEFQEHPQKSFSIVKSEFKTQFAFEENTDAIKLHHIKLNESQFVPLEDYQVAISLADEMVDYSEKSFYLGDSVGVLRDKFLKLKNERNELRIKYGRVINIIEKSMESNNLKTGT